MLFILGDTQAYSTRGGWKNKAMIWNAGKYFYNYRMEVSVFYIRNILKDFGFDNKDLMHIKADNIICNSNAINCPSLRNVPHDPNQSILRSDFEADYAFRDNTPTKYLELLVNRYEPREANKHKIERDERTNFFFYTIGHGGNLYFKIQDTEVVFARQVSDYLNDPAQQLKHRESFLLSDSCSAGTLFSECKDVKHTYMLGTSSWEQKSTSYDEDRIYTTPLNDKFVHYFRQLVLPLMKKEGFVSLHKVKQLLDKSLLQSDLLTFNQMARADSSVYLNDFMQQGEVRSIQTVKAHGEKVDALINGFFSSSS